MTFKINRVYTRSGDDGKTGLVDGSRVSKASLRVSAYGDIDEANSFLGLAKEELGDKLKELRQIIEDLQQQLFDIGAELATPPDSKYPAMTLVNDADVSQLEKLCDHYGDGLPELTSFILPGGSRIAALFHIVRTVSRRAERTIISLHDQDTSSVRPEVIKFINRVSDLCFILARWVLEVEGHSVPLWVKKSERIDK